MTFLELARRVVVDPDEVPRSYAVNEENERNEVIGAAPRLRIWVCVGCRVPRSLGDEPCPNCRVGGRFQTAGRWFAPPHPRTTVKG